MTHSSQLRRFLGLSSRFLVVGALSTVIEVVSFNLFIYVSDLDAVWAKILASLVALINAYFGNREWTFKGRGEHRRTFEMLLFLLVNGICTLLGAAIVWVGLIAFPEAGPIMVNVVNLFSIGLVVVARFTLYHYIVFKGVRPLRVPSPRD